MPATGPPHSTRETLPSGSTTRPFGYGQCDDPERPQLLFRRAAPVPIWGGGDPGRLAEARDALLTAGDNTRAAEAECHLSETFGTAGPA